MLMLDGLEAYPEEILKICAPEINMEVVLMEIYEAMKLMVGG